MERKDPLVVILCYFKKWVQLGVELATLASAAISATAITRPILATVVPTIACRLESGAFRISLSRKAKMWLSDLR